MKVTMLTVLAIAIGAAIAAIWVWFIMMLSGALSHVLGVEALNISFFEAIPVMIALTFITALLTPNRK